MTKTTTKPQAADVREARIERIGDVYRLSITQAGDVTDIYEGPLLFIIRECLKLGEQPTFASQPTPSAVGECAASGQAFKPNCQCAFCQRQRVAAPAPPLDATLREKVDIRGIALSVMQRHRASGESHEVMARDISIAVNAALAQPQAIDATLWEKVARLLCELDGYDPDGGPKIGFGWRNYTERADKVLALAQPQTIDAGEDAAFNEGVCTLALWCERAITEAKYGPTVSEAQRQGMRDAWNAANSTASMLLRRDDMGAMIVSPAIEKMMAERRAATPADALSDGGGE